MLSNENVFCGTPQKKTDMFLSQDTVGSEDVRLPMNTKFKRDVSGGECYVYIMS